MESKLDSLNIYALVSVLLLTVLLVAFGPSSVTGKGAQIEDETGDIVTACSGEKPEAGITGRNGSIDIVKASVNVDRERNELRLAIRTKEPIPKYSRSLMSYSFVLDLDGGASTGFVGNRPPVGVFPEMGIDLWANFSLYKNEEKDFGSLGFGIPDLNRKANLVNYNFEDNRTRLVFGVNLPRLELLLRYGYSSFSATWKVDPERMKWAAFTSWSPSSSESKVADYASENFYQQGKDGCLVNPLVEL